ncbi:MAG: protein translocase subunit SecF [Acidobacteria bacterium]|nr:protein translocase subunit SecF [Acidobacteriota bacterium]
MEFFRNSNIDWIGKKWYFIGLSFVLSAVGIASLLAKGGPRYGVDFKGGTQIHIQFQEAPPLDRIRAALGSQGLSNSTLQRFGPESNHEILIALDLEATTEEDLDAGRRAIEDALRSEFGGTFEVRNVEIVGPKVGAALRRRALNATLLGLASMMIYIAFRFEWVYGVAAVIAALHDVVIAMGALSLANRELTLTVIAALLTLVGYSVNDTIVVFDRVRENVKLMRRQSITEIVNRSINQTLSRTVLTSGLTFLAVLVLFLLGGEVLRGFAFTLVVGIVVGTYSSIGIASTLVVSWQEYVNRHRRSGAVAPSERETSREKGARLGAGVKA